MARPITPLVLPDIEPAVHVGARPEIRDVAPATLYVDDAYQRALSDRSIRLIRKIVAEWDWQRYKPPVVTVVDGDLHVIDGQHTAIAAASHGGLTTIPVMVVAATDMADRARAFVGHNRDRIGVTGPQIHFALLAAGDEDALTLAQVCERAGARLLRYPPSNGVFAAGDTMALTTIRSLINKRSPMKARIVLQVLVEAACAPVSADLIKAVDTLLHETDYAGEIAPADLTLIIRARGAEAERDARGLALAKGLPHWRALAITLFRLKGKARGSRAAG